MTATRFGNYMLNRRIAAGSMAEFFEAKRIGSSGLEKGVVIKRILPKISQDELERSHFTREAGLVAELKHPNIVQVVDFGLVDDRLFIAMEFVSGVDLLNVISRQKTQQTFMPHELAVYVTMEILKALHYAHSHEDAADGTISPIIHRNITPSNVLIAFDGQVKLTDFGIAKALGERGELATFTSDLFAVGVLLHMLLSNRRPIESRSLLDQLTPPIPDDLIRIVMQALSPDPLDRFQSATDFLAPLETFLALHAGSDYGVRLSKYIRRIFQSEVTVKEYKLSSSDTEPERALKDLKAPEPTEEFDLPEAKSDRQNVNPIRSFWIAGALIALLMVVAAVAIVVYRLPPKASPISSVPVHSLSSTASPVNNPIPVRILIVDLTGKGSALVSQLTQTFQAPAIETSQLDAREGAEASPTAIETAATHLEAAKSLYRDLKLNEALAEIQLSRQNPDYVTLRDSYFLEAQLQKVLRKYRAMRRALENFALLGGNPLDGSYFGPTLLKQYKAARKKMLARPVALIEIRPDLPPNVAVEISVDGTPVGKAPAQLSQFRIGPHFIELKAPGFATFDTTLLLKRSGAVLTPILKPLSPVDLISKAMATEHEQERSHLLKLVFLKTQVHGIVVLQQELIGVAKGNLEVLSFRPTFTIGLTADELERIKSAIVGPSGTPSPGDANIGVK